MGNEPDVEDYIRWLEEHIEEGYDRERRAYVFYHHECSYGTSCDACMLHTYLNKIKDLLQKPVSYAEYRANVVRLGLDKQQPILDSTDIC